MSARDTKSDQSGGSILNLLLFVGITAASAYLVSNNFNAFPIRFVSSSTIEDPEDVLGVEVDIDGVVSSVEHAVGSFEKRYSSSDKRIYTKEELALYDGSDADKPIWLAMMGEVFDVTKGKAHYGKNGGYGFFSGKDATAAFVTGKFKDGLTEDVSELSPSQLLGIEDWVGFYRSDYTPIGILEGMYYDHNGNPTDALGEYGKGLDVGQAEKRKDDAMKKKYPSCNSRSGQNIDSQVWCSDKSGGVERSWAGVPRKLHEPGKERQRCVCVEYELAKDDPRMRVYEGCNPTSIRCTIKKVKK